MTNRQTKYLLKGSKSIYAFQEKEKKFFIFQYSFLRLKQQDHSKFFSKGEVRFNFNFLFTLAYA